MYICGAHEDTYTHIFCGGEVKAGEDIFGYVIPKKPLVVAFVNAFI